VESLPINLAPAEFLQQLDAIGPGVWGTLCEVTLDDGRSFDHCLAWENPRFSDKGNWISPEHVMEIRACRCRMPVKFAQLVQRAGESGMGYHIYVVELADKTSFVHLAGGLDIDLLNLPEGYSDQDVVNVLPHEGRERAEVQGYREVDDYQSLEYARAV